MSRLSEKEVLKRIENLKIIKRIESALKAGKIN